MTVDKIIRFGTEYGGFYYPENLDYIKEDSIVYCIGVGEDISHDIAISKDGMSIFLFDPTPRAIQHTKEVIKFLAGEIKKPEYNIRCGGGDPKYWDIISENKIDPKKIKLEEIGVYIEDEVMNFYCPENLEHVSHSLLSKTYTNYGFMAQVKKISSIMKEKKHKKIDLLKIDIEGVECMVINQMLQEKIYPIYLTVDFDSFKYSFNGKFQIDETINSLTEHGYKILWNENLNATFFKKENK